MHIRRWYDRLHILDACQHAQTLSVREHGSASPNLLKGPFARFRQILYTRLGGIFSGHMPDYITDCCATLGPCERGPAQAADLAAAELQPALGRTKPPEKVSCSPRMIRRPSSELIHGEQAQEGSSSSVLRPLYDEYANLQMLSIPLQQVLFTRNGPLEVLQS